MKKSSKITAAAMGDKFVELIANFPKLKQEFDTLETYDEKLQWWEKNEVYKSPVLHTFGLADEEKKDFNNPDVTISIQPKNNEETAKFNQMAKRVYEKKYPRISFEGKVTKFEETIKDKHRPKIFIEHEIHLIEQRLEKQRNILQSEYKRFLAGYETAMYGGQYDVLLNSFYPDQDNEFSYVDFFDGMNTAKYHGFLLERLNEIDNPGMQLKGNFKLTWKGDKKILLDIFHQLKRIANKKHEYLIPNTSDEIAQFLIGNFDCFSNTKPATLRRVLDSSGRPKNRIDIEEMIKEQ
jgi:hypothetical protein